MSENIRPKYGVSRVSGDTLDLLEDEEVRCLELTSIQCSILRQMTFPWAGYRERLVNEFPSYWEIVDQPVAYVEALEDLEVKLSGAYDGPKEGCPVGMEYVDRGDLPGYDFTIATLVADNAWHEMDLVNVIGDPDATLVIIRTVFVGALGSHVGYREDENTATVNILLARSPVTDVICDFEGIVKMSIPQKIEYRLHTGITACNVCVRGYWRPAA